MLFHTEKYGYMPVQLMTARSTNTYRAGAGTAGAVQDPAGLVLVPHGLELPAGGSSGANTAMRSHATTGHDDRVTVLVDTVRGLAVLLLSLVLHLAQDWYTELLTGNRLVPFITLFGQYAAARGCVSRRSPRHYL
jgi:hypothetical protein